MSGSPPTLHPSGNEVWQYAQAVTAISAIAARVRGQLQQARQRHGRLAFADAEHATRLHETRQRPPTETITFADAPAKRAVAAERRPGQPPAEPGAPALSEATWTAALRQQLPPELADRVVVTDRTHPHHAAWRELHALANHETTRVGADPEQLARLVASIPRWRGVVRNPPALAHWALTEAVRSSGYVRTVTSSTAASVTAPLAAHSPAPAATRSVDTRPVAPVRTKPAAPRLRPAAGRRDDAVPTPADKAASGAGTDVTRPAGAAELISDVARLDPGKPIDCRAAGLMLGRVPPEVDRLLVAKFGHDPRFARRLRAVYPNGLPDADCRNTPAGAVGTASDQDRPRVPAPAAVAGGQAALPGHTMRSNPTPRPARGRRG